MQGSGLCEQPDVSEDQALLSLLEELDLIWELDLTGTQYN